RRQAGRTPNAPRILWPREWRNSRQRLECVELAPAFALPRPPRPFESAGKPDALQTLRAFFGQGSGGTRASVWSAWSLLPLSHCRNRRAHPKAPASRTHSKRSAHSFAKGVSELAKRLECVELAPAFVLRKPP